MNLASTLHADANLLPPALRWSSGGVIFSPPNGSRGRNAGSPQVIASLSSQHSKPFSLGGSNSPLSGGTEFYVSFMTDEDVGTLPQWVQNAEVKVMRGSLQPGGGLVFDAAGRWLVGPHLSLWPGLVEFGNRSYALYGHQGVAHCAGPLEAHYPQTLKLDDDENVSMVRVGAGACRPVTPHTCMASGCNVSFGVAHCRADPGCGAVDFDPRHSQCCFWRDVPATVHASEADCDVAPHPAGCVCYRKSPLPPPPPPPPLPPPPPPVGPCRDAFDCELNGQCHAGVCVCSRGWKGQQCGELDLLPVASAAAVGFVPSDESETLSCSWGGNIIQEPHGQYSLIAASMRAHCGINAWGTNSEIVMAVSDSPHGP